MAIAQNRLALLSVEAQAEGARLGAMLVYGVAAVLCLVFGLVFLAVLLTVLMWEGQRLLALGIFTAVFLTLGGVFLALAMRLKAAGSSLFSASLAELAKDREKLRSGDM